MLNFRRRMLLLCIGAILSISTCVQAQMKGYPIKPVLFTDVKVQDDFWSKRLETNRTVSIPYAFQQCEQTGRVRNFQIADSVLSGLISEGKFCTRYGFDDSDVYKIIEGASYSLHTHYDPKLDAYVDSIVMTIAKAQEKDGYLYTMRTIKPEASWAKERWVNDRTGGSHELYNVGHLYEAAVAHFYATGKRSLLDIALRSADLLCKTFGPFKLRTVPGHQVTEIGLTKLYLVSGKQEYLELARFFIDERGKGDPTGESYNQDHKPVVDQPEAVGHAVRAGYLYAGMADVAALIGEEEYLRALDRFWEDVVTKKMYLTGGVGSVGNIEGYGPPYLLPNLSAYCETCAAIALVYWNHRMFLLRGDAKYYDIIERAIYNGFLSGVSMEGNRFFYPNPLESIKGAQRSPWFACACCPSNDVRFVPSIPGYVYAHARDELYINLFIGGEARIPMEKNAVRVTQKSNYPWDGNISIAVDPEEKGKFAVNVRIPGWAQGRPVPGDLYTYADGANDPVVIKVNSNPVTYRIQKGFARLEREWVKGDLIVLELPMPVRRVRAHEKVEDDRDKVALERGPIVYCLEGPDNKDDRVLNLVISEKLPFETAYAGGLLGGVQTIRGKAVSVSWTLEGKRVTGPEQEFVAIPYYAWAHRGTHPMAVWPAREVWAAKPLPAPTIAFRSTATASGAKDVDAVADQLVPAHSNDHSVPYSHWWPKKGTTEWVQYDLPAPAKVSKVKVYWYDDTGTGECRVPKSWRVLYKSGDTWKPVTNPSAWEVTKDTLNEETFSPVETDGVRLEVQLQQGFSSGVYEWVVE